MSPDAIVDPSRVLGPDPRAYAVRGSYIEHLSGMLDDPHVSGVSVGAMVTEEPGRVSTASGGGEQLVVVKSSQREYPEVGVELSDQNYRFQSEAVVLHVNLTLPEGAAQYINLIPSAINALSSHFGELAEPNVWVVIDGSKYPARSVWFGGARTIVSDLRSRLSFSIFRAGVSPLLQLSSFERRGSELGITGRVYARSESNWRRAQIAGPGGRLRIEELHSDYMNLLDL